jgi:hypothetical protein
MTLKRKALIGAVVLLIVGMVLTDSIPFLRVPWTYWPRPYVLWVGEGYVNEAEQVVRVSHWFHAFTAYTTFARCLAERPRPEKRAGTALIYECFPSETHPNGGP